MKKLSEAMGLEWRQLKPQTFVDRYADVMKESFDAEKRLNEIYLVGRDFRRPRNKRIKKRDKSDSIQEILSDPSTEELS